MGGSRGWDVCVGVLFLCFGFTYFRGSLKMEIRKVEAIWEKKNIPPSSFFLCRGFNAAACSVCVVMSQFLKVFLMMLCISVYCNVAKEVFS